MFGQYLGEKPTVYDTVWRFLPSDQFQLVEGFSKMFFEPRYWVTSNLSVSSRLPEASRISTRHGPISWV